MAISRAGRKRLILAVVGLAFVTALGAGYFIKEARLSANMDRWLEQGTAAYERGEYEQALELLNKYVSRDKSNPEAMLNFADTRRQIPLANQEHLTQAQSIVQSALEYEPDSLRGWTMLMEIYTSFSPPLFTEARNAAERIIQLDPTHKDAHVTRIDSLIAVNDQEGARAAAFAMAKALPDDLGIQQIAFGKLANTQASLPELEGFVNEREPSFAGRLGLELMRIGLAARRLQLAAPGEKEAAQEKLAEAADAALDAPAETASEVISLITFLESAARRNAMLADSVLERYLADQDLAPDLVPFAAQRLWSQGRAEEAGRLVVDHTPELTEAEDSVLGWLALAGIPESEQAAALLTQRSSPTATYWAALVSAAQSLSEPGARLSENDLPTRAPRGTSLELLQPYIRGVIHQANGETARAANQWQLVLDDAPHWLVARTKLAAAQAEMGELLAARDTLMDDYYAAGTRQHLLIEIRIDERGLTRPDGGRDSYELLAPTVDIEPARASTLALAARAALATGQFSDAAELTDRLLEGDLTQDTADLVGLAGALVPHDPQRAAALREALANTATDPQSVYRLAIADSRAGHPLQGLERIERQATASGTSDSAEWQTTRAMYLDEIGDPRAADALLEAAASHPDQLGPQLAALDSEATWDDPASLTPVIERVRNITGRNGTLWRTYDGKRTIATLDPDSPSAADRARQVMIELSTIANEDPRNAQAAETVARAAQITGDHRNAAEFLLRAVRADPDNLARRLELINSVLPRAGRLEEARRQALALTSLTLRTPEQRRARAETLDSFGLTAEAQPDWDALAAAGDAEAGVRRAAALAIRDRREEADAIIERVIASDDLSPAARLGAASYLHNAGRADEALALVQAADDPGLLSQHLILSTDSPERAEFNEQLAREINHPAVWNAAVQSYLVREDQPAARRVLAEAVDAFPNSPELDRFVALFEAQEQNRPTAPLLELRAIIGDPNQPLLQRIAVLIDDFTSGRIESDRLTRGLRDLTSENRDSMFAWGALAAAHTARGDNDAVAATYREAMEAMPASPEIARLAARRFDQLGLPDEALRATQVWRERLGRRDFQADLVYALMLFQRDRSREALAALQPWRSDIVANRDQAPGDAAILAYLLASNGEEQQAVNALAPLLGQSTDTTAYCIQLATHMPDPAARKAWLDTLMPVVTDAASAELFELLAAEWQQWAIDSGAAPTQVRAATIAAETLLQSEAGRQPAVVRLAALGRENLGDDEQAADHYRTLLEIEPQDPAWPNNLALLLLRRGEADEALTHADRAVALAEAAALPPLSRRSFVETRGQVLLALGRAEDAVADYRRALEPDPTWEIGLEGLARALEAAGQPAEAEQVRATLEASALSDD